MNQNSGNKRREMPHSIRAHRCAFAPRSAKTLAITIGVMLATAKLPRMISLAKITPARGALNVALMPGRGTGRDQHLDVWGRHAEELTGHAAQRRSDLHDGPFATDGASRTDADGAGQDLDQRHAGTNDPVVPRYRHNHLGHPVALGLREQSVRVNQLTATKPAAGIRQSKAVVCRIRQRPREDRLDRATRDKVDQDREATGPDARQESQSSPTAESAKAVWARYPAEGSSTSEEVGCLAAALPPRLLLDIKIASFSPLGPARVGLPELFRNHSRYGRPIEPERSTVISCPADPNSPTHKQQRRRQRP